MARQAPLNFQNYLTIDQIVIPTSVATKIAALQLRLKDVLWTLNFPMQEKQEGEGKYTRKRWFGSYWVGLLCKWSEREQRWVLFTCWKEETLG